MVVDWEELTGAVRYNSVFQLTVAEVGEEVGGAAEFERSCALEVLAFEKQVNADVVVTLI